MKLVSRAVFAIVANAIALFVAGYFIEGFTVANDLVSLAIAGAILAALNLFLRPLLKLFFGPLMVLTLGLFSIVVSGLLLYILDIVSAAVTIEGYTALLLGAIIVGVVNAVLHGSARKIGD